MRQASSLRLLRQAALHRAMRLRTLAFPLAPPVNNHMDRDIAYLTIETSNLWASFSRSFFLSCMFSGKHDAGGRVRCGPTFGSVKDVISFAVTTIKPRGTEPNWSDPGILLLLLKVVGASNFAIVKSAFSYSTTVFRDLPSMRNFFAHRDEGTAKKTVRVARSVGVSVHLRPSEILCSRSPSRPQNVITDWIDDLRNIITLACH